MAPRGVGKSRISSLNLTLLVGVTLAARGAARFAYESEGAAPPGWFEPPPGPARSAKQHRNPIVLAQGPHRALRCTPPREWARAGYARAKRCKGTKMHLVVDTRGHLLTAVVPAAGSWSAARMGSPASGAWPALANACPRQPTAS